MVKFKLFLPLLLIGIKELILDPCKPSNQFLFLDFLVFDWVQLINWVFLSKFISLTLITLTSPILIPSYYSSKPKKYLKIYSQLQKKMRSIKDSIEIELNKETREIKDSLSLIN